MLRSDFALQTVSGMKIDGFNNICIQRYLFCKEIEGLACKIKIPQNFGLKVYCEIVLTQNIEMKVYREIVLTQNIGLKVS